MVVLFHSFVAEIFFLQCVLIFEMKILLVTG